jgi:hypothetical protein
MVFWKKTNHSCTSSVSKYLSFSFFEKQLWQNIYSKLFIFMVHNWYHWKDLWIKPTVVYQAHARSHPATNYSTARLTHVAAFQLTLPEIAHSLLHRKKSNADRNRSFSLLVAGERRLQSGHVPILVCCVSCRLPSIHRRAVACCRGATFVLIYCRPGRWRHYPIHPSRSPVRASRWASTQQSQSWCAFGLFIQV